MKEPKDFEIDRNLWQSQRKQDICTNFKVLVHQNIGTFGRKDFVWNFNRNLLQQMQKLKHYQVNRVPQLMKDKYTF